MSPRVGFKALDVLLAVAQLQAEMRPGAPTAREVEERCGYTVLAVRKGLLDLMEAGLVERVQENIGSGNRGPVPYLYRVSPGGLRFGYLVLEATGNLPR